MIVKPGGGVVEQSKQEAEAYHHSPHSKRWRRPMERNM